MIPGYPKIDPIHDSIIAGAVRVGYIMAVEQMVMVATADGDGLGYD